MRLTLLTIIALLSACTTTPVVKEIDFKYGTHAAILFFCGKPLYMTGANLDERERGTVAELAPDVRYETIKRIIQDAKLAGTVDVVKLENLFGFPCPEEVES